MRSVADWLRGKRENAERAKAAATSYVEAVNLIPYHPQGPEVSALADAIRAEHRRGGLGYDSGTYMEAARGALNALSRAGLIVVPVPGHPGPPDA
jgi:hypothetical protein